MDELYSMTATQLRNGIQEKHIGIEELTRLYLERIEKYGGKDGLNVIAEINESAIEQAKAMDSQSIRDLPLFGLPILVKDNIDVAGLHTTAGSLALCDNIAKEDAPIIANLRRNGAVILGKANMTEFANYTTSGMPNGYSSRGGQVKHAYNPSADPGGSSTGSAVAVCAGLCCAAIGTDTSFSVIGCAAENGVTGLKPAYNSLPTKGIVPISHTLDMPGTLTQNMADALMVYSAMRDKPLEHIAPANPKKLNIAINTYNKDKVSEAQLGRYERLFSSLQSAGASFSEVFHRACRCMGDIMCCEFRHDLEEYLESSSAKMKTLEEIIKCYEANADTMTKYGITRLRSAMDEASGTLDDRQYIDAMTERRKLRAEVMENLKGYDACVMTGPTNIMHFVGIPSVALRLCMADDNTPRGIILYGADEKRLFSAALTIERYCERITPPKL